jgi:hypothetical protein
MWKGSHANAADSVYGDAPRYPIVAISFEHEYGSSIVCDTESNWKDSFFSVAVGHNCDRNTMKYGYTEKMSSDWKHVVASVLMA